MDKRIIINADDFGVSSGVNKAVAQAHTDGVLTSATIMANMPAAVAAVKLAKQMPNLGVGVHLNLFEGRPLSKDGSIGCLLDDNGSFALTPAKLSLLSIVKHKIRNAIRTELAAQIQWVIDNGIKPTHLDSHKHIHSFPTIFPIVCGLARRFEIPAIRFIFEPKQLLAMPWPLPSEGGRKRARTARIMAKINRIQNSDFLKTDCLLGVAHMGKIDVNFFKAVALYNSAATTEVMTHPGLDNGMEHSKSNLHQRKGELQTLCSERTKQYFKNAGIKLVHYGQLRPA
jgi:hopanoid biosynthesis associated protein HpnK